MFAALADPTRRAILARLARGDATVNEIAGPFAMTLQAVSKHLKVLERAGLVTRGRQAQYRPVRLEPAGFDPAARWLAEHREMRLAQLDRLEQTIRTLRTAGTLPGPEPPGPEPTDPALTSPEPPDSAPTDPAPTSPAPTSPAPDAARPTDAPTERRSTP